MFDVSKKITLFLLAILLFLGSLTPVIPQQVVGPRYGGTFIEVISGDPTSFAWWKFPTVEGSQLEDKVYDTLVYYRLKEPRGYEIVPALAESYEASADGTTFTLHLVRNAAWHDGVEFTSADVKFFIDKIVVPYHARYSTKYKAELESVETPDKYTVVVKFKHGNSVFLLSEAVQMRIYPKHIYDDPKYPDPLENPAIWNPMGTGAWKFKEYVSGDHITLVRNENYWKKDSRGGDLPYLDKIILKIVTDPKQAILAFEKGEVDILNTNQVPLMDIERFQATPGVSVTMRGCESDSQILFLCFNLRPPHPTSNILVREALWHAINKTDIIEKAGWGFGNEANSPIHSSDIFYNPKFDTNPYPYDVAKANQLLDEAGYPRKEGGIRFKLNNVFTSVYAINSKVAEILRERAAII
jgi:peptide/nickel transport system substrate-binding protein